MKKRIAFNISWLMIDKLIRIFLGLIISIWVARYLGPKNYGYLNYGLAFVSLFLIFSKLGLDQIVVRELVKRESYINVILGSSFFLKLLGSIVSVFLIIITMFLLKENLYQKKIIFIMSLSLIFQSLDVIDYYYQSLIYSKYIVISRVIAFIICTFLKLFFILYKYPVIYFAFIFSFEFFLSGIFMLFAYFIKNNKRIKWKISLRECIVLLKYSSVLAISSFLITIYSRIDQVMIGNLLNKTEVGIYTVAVKLSQAWYFIPNIIINTLMPYFVKLKERDKTLYNERLLQLYSLMFWLGFIVGLLTVIYGKKIILILYGKKYISSYKALVFNIWNGIFISQAIARGIWMIAENLQKYRLFNNILSVSLNIFANIILIPKMGISGAALATLLTQAAGTWIFGFIWKPLRESNLMLLKSINPFYLFKIVLKV